MIPDPGEKSGSPAWVPAVADQWHLVGESGGSIERGTSVACGEVAPPLALHRPDATARHAARLPHRRQPGPPPLPPRRPPPCAAPRQSGPVLRCPLPGARIEPASILIAIKSFAVCRMSVLGANSPSMARRGTVSCDPLRPWFAGFGLAGLVVRYPPI